MSRRTVKNQISESVEATNQGTHRAGPSRCGAQCKT